MRNTIYASFSDPCLSERAARVLFDFGMRQQDLSIVMSTVDEPEAAPPEEVAIGAVRGSTWAANFSTVSFLTTLSVPGIGMVIGEGALANAIGALSDADVVAPGAITGCLKDRGVEPNLAEEYEKTILTGGAILALTLPSGSVDEAIAWKILVKYAGHNVTNYAQNPYLG